MTKAPTAKKKPPSAKSKAAKARREKAGMGEEMGEEMVELSAIETPLTDTVRDRLEKSYDKTWGANTEEYGGDDAPWIEESYPPTKLSEGDLLNAEEAQAAEEQMLGKRGVPHHETCPRSFQGSFAWVKCNCDAERMAKYLQKDAKLDDSPAFLHASAKAGPPVPLLDALGRTPKERKERKIVDAIALGEVELNKDKPTTAYRTTTILRDHDLGYPDLYLAVYVAGDWDVRDDEARFARLFARSGCYRANTVEEADLVVFGGGSDIEPLLYGEDNDQRHPLTYFNSERDAADIEIYVKARNQGTPMMGVCRGAQFLHVMNGGKLYQDVDGHHGPHKGFALKEKLLIEGVSSVHHQACVINKEMEVLMITSKSTVRWLGKDVKDQAGKTDIEAFFYRDSGCFGVQGHPEYSGCNKFSIWCLEKISDLFLCSPDFTWSGKRLEMTKAARDAQQIAEQYVENAYNQSKEA